MPMSSKRAHQEQHAGGRDQHADAVGRDVGRHAGGLFALGQAFDAERIDHDVLRRRRRRTSSAPSATNSGERAGSVSASSTIAPISSSCENTSQPRRRPKRA